MADNNNKMLIDAAHPEETRVVVLRGDRVEEFDYESASRKPLRGNIFLAKVTRVEPSLQAAFVDYGGNRHGFLAFNEIHPDYYQIPVADRQALLAEEAAEQRAERDGEERAVSRQGGERRRSGGGSGRDDEDGPNVARASDDDDADGEAAFDADDRNGDGDPDEGDDELRADSDEADGETLESSSDDDGDAATGDDANEDADEPADDDADGKPREMLESSGLDDPVISEEHSGDEGTTLQENTASTSTSEPGQAGAATASAFLGFYTAPMHPMVPQPSAEAPASVGQQGSEGPIGDADADADGNEGSLDVDRAEGGEAGNGDGLGRRHRRSRRRRVRSRTGDNGGARRAEGDQPEAGRAEDDAAAPRRERPARGRRRNDDEGDEDADREDQIEDVGQEDALEEVPRRMPKLRRQYRIQEVIRRRQIVLVQVVKEERGNKGAALTTYLSLAGRYCVLMPNTPRGGGISRKITNQADRKRLREIASELEVPEGMGLIIRTAGASRTKAELKRDYEYLLRLWENVRDLTLKSNAPSLVYEEGNLIKRSIRDLYSKEVEEIIVAGEDGYREAKDFMRMLTPSHAKNVKLYRDPEPLFTRYKIERQLNAMFNPVVTLKSGGYIVLNQTEALVSVDVNSGKSTREHSIEETALATNLEAAAEVARQLRLRDLAGLIVIDFIDMEERRNNRLVERRFKECLKDDRARIQVGKISGFGLLEMSRQRLRPGVVEGSTTQCPHCLGTGVIRSVESVALAVLRGLEEALIGQTLCDLIAVCTAEASLYILNHKRDFIREIEARYGVSILVQADDRLQGANFRIDQIKGTARPAPARDTAIKMHSAFVDDLPEDEIEDEAEETPTKPEVRTSGEDEDEAEERRSKRRRRRRRGGRDERDEGSALEARKPAGTGSPQDREFEAEADGDDEEDDSANGGLEESERGDDETAGNGDEARKRSRRRGKRGGRKNRRGNGEVTAGAAPDRPDESGSGDRPIDVRPDDEGDASTGAPATGERFDPFAHVSVITLPDDEPLPPLGDEAEAADAPKSHARTAPIDPGVENAGDRSEPPSQPAPERERAEIEEPSAQARTGAPEIAKPAAPEPAKPAAPQEPDRPKRRGWWQTALGRD
ncbi:MAG: Rne/Rng family ribonuclease [Rhizobiales bacterium]|nr:Rne/Rng family ribonuclease [Hyphomicrobiales bacterium]